MGSPALLYLTAAGVGTIGIVDFDVVDDSNLQRQVLFDIHEIGNPKWKRPSRRLEALNPHTRFIFHNTHINSENALDIIKDYDVVADGTDNFPTRYLVNDATLLLDKPNVYASIFQFEGQVSVFNYVNKWRTRSKLPGSLSNSTATRTGSQLCRRRRPRCIARHYRKPSGTGSNQSDYGCWRTIVRQILHF